jgi:ParB family transcriptional regulator, chromosome partitioning protein
MNLPIDKIIPDPNQPRKTFEDMEDLEQSIKTHGLIQAITVDSDYHIIDGERRWRAAKNVGIKEVPALMLDSDGKRHAWQIVADVQHKSVPVQERDQAWFKLWVELKKPDYTEFSKVVGKDRRIVADSIERAQFLPERLSAGTYEQAEPYNRTRFIKDPNIRAKVIEKIDKIGTNTSKDQYLKRVKKAIDEGNVDEVLEADITNWVKIGDAVIYNINAIIRDLKPGLILNLPKPQAVVLSERITALQHHLKTWDAQEGEIV